MAHDDLTDDTFDLEELDSELETAHSGAQSTAPRSGAQAGLLLLAGFGSALFGLAISVGPLASWKAAQIMVGLDYLGVHGGTLFVGGLVLMGLGMLRRGQHAIAVNADEAHGDTAVIEEVATDVVQMRNALDHMQRVSSQVQDEVGELKRIIEAQVQVQAQVQAAAPTAPTGDTQGDAVFRLAATLDKLGARIEERMKSQFSTLQERLTSVESSFETSQEAIEGQLEQLARASVPEPELGSTPAPSYGPEPAQEFAREFAQELPDVPAPVQEAPAVPVDSPLGVLDTIEPDEPQAPLSQPAQDEDFSQGLHLAEVQSPAPSAALPTQQPASPWGGELQVGATEAALSPEERERLLAETRLRQSLQNMQQHPDQGAQDFSS